MRPGEANEWSGGRFSPEGSEEMGTFPTDTSERCASSSTSRTPALRAISARPLRCSSSASILSHILCTPGPGTTLPMTLPTGHRTTCRARETRLGVRAFHSAINLTARLSYSVNVSDMVHPWVCC